MSKKKIILPIIFILAALAAFGLPDENTSAQQPSAPAGDGCITAKCHAGMDQVKYVHGPVAAGECKACHGESAQHASNPKRNKFNAITDIAGACYKCHDKFAAKKFSHSPIDDGECTACHNPHGSDFKFQLISKEGEVCFMCHDEELVAGNFVHGPAAVGGCVACHDPHTADFEKNLRAEGPTLCFSCHTDKADTFYQSEFIHKPVTDNCTGCHNPHSAARQFMLQSSAPALCYTCHDDKKEEIANAPVPHGAVQTERTCLNCHDPHNSNVAKNLVSEPLDLCLSCHDREYKKEEGKAVMDIKTWLAENTDHHGPIKQKDCSGCHNPHGSPHFKILRNPYPSTFYKPFAVENYSLCFGCHEKTIVLNPETTKLTNFRNGNENLHFTHVNKAIKGRTCRACHETHASNFPKHIREAVPFGSWELPVNYEKTETGGSCTPGCHKQKRYDRVKRVTNG